MTHTTKSPTTTCLHQFLQYHQHPQPDEPTIFCPIVWDLREAPLSSARHVSDLEVALNNQSLNLPATFPTIPWVTITCALLPADWAMHAMNTSTVTIRDVLLTIYCCLRVPITDTEWSKLSDKQKSRVEKTFERRCELAINPLECAAAGKMRIDFLGKHTIFGGLSMSLEPGKDNVCILSLRRPPRVSS